MSDLISGSSVRTASRRAKSALEGTMRNRRLLLAMMSFVCMPVLSARGQGASALKLVQKIPMPNVQDRLDHLGVDATSKRLFIAALGDKQNTVEVVDLKSNKRISSIPGQSKPQGIFYSPDFKKLFVANGTDGTCKILAGDNLTAIVLKSNSDDPSFRQQFKQKDVFVRNVDFVKIPDQATVPSVIRLYLGNDGVEERGASGVYFDAMKGVFDLFPRLSNGEAVVARDGPRSMLVKNARPGVIESNAQIVNYIPGNKGQSQKALIEFGMFMLDEFCSSVTVSLECGNCFFFHGRDSGFQVTNMLIGPIKLEPSISKERCSHATLYA